MWMGLGMGIGMEMQDAGRGTSTISAAGISGCGWALDLVGPSVPTMFVHFYVAHTCRTCRRCPSMSWLLLVVLCPARLCLATRRQEMYLH